MKYSLLLSLLIVGCAPVKDADPRNIVGINIELVPYVNEYIKHKGMGLYYDIPMQFANLEGNTVGRCSRWSTGHRQILIDKYFWNTSSEGQRFELLAHELGHCDLNRGHSDSKLSVMYPSVFTLQPSTINNYMNELFNR